VCRTARAPHSFPDRAIFSYIDSPSFAIEIFNSFHARPAVPAAGEGRLERLDQGKQRGLGFAADPLIYFLGNSVRKSDAPRRTQPENGTQETGMENNLQCSMIRQKTARLELALVKVKAFVAAGGDLKSPAAFLDGWELVDAFAELAEEFNYEILISMNDRTVEPGCLFRVSVAGRS
jgi:hypothetical protein